MFSVLPQQIIRAGVVSIAWNYWSRQEEITVDHARSQTDKNHVGQGQANI